MCCLEKDKERRYQSVGELAVDLQRFLNREPISARAPNAWYVLRKFAERHRTAVTAASLTLCALLVATAVSTWLAVRATHAEGLAQETIDALVSMFDAADPFASPGAPFSADELLKSAQRTAYAAAGVSRGASPASRIARARPATSRQLQGKRRGVAGRSAPAQRAFEVRRRCSDSHNHRAVRSGVRERRQRASGSTVDRGRGADSSVRPGALTPLRAAAAEARDTGERARQYRGGP